MDGYPYSAINLRYIEELYEEWRRDRSSVSPEWAAVFDSIPSAPHTAELNSSAAAVGGLVLKQSRFDSLLWAYRDVGYLYARLNPLVGYLSADLHFLYDQEESLYERLTLREFGLNERDLDVVLSAGRSLKPQKAPLRNHLKALQEIYCSTIGVEFLHIQNNRIRRWIIDKVESNRNKPNLDPTEKRRILHDLFKAEEFEHFLHTQFIGQKRFSLEGTEVLIPALHHLADGAVDMNVEELVLGMSHRGRLNVIANVMNKPADEIFMDFEDVLLPDLYGGSGDVKYHRGYRCDHVNEDGRRILINLVPNPSHLESVDPVVEGFARGIQHGKKDKERKKVLPVLIHGDAAFSGQGVVPETLNLSRLRGYGTGGTIHFVINNQIGFTTSTKDARSTFFPTDVAKMLPIPIFHVNGDDPEAVVHVTDLALKFRQEFGRDVIVDIFCYRRHGHNEGDEPSFTHPKMYQFIRHHRSASKKYGEGLNDLQVMGEAEQEEFLKSYRSNLKDLLAKSRSKEAAGVSGDSVETGSPTVAVSGASAVSGGGEMDGAVDASTLSTIVDRLSAAPPRFHIHPKLERIVKEREKRFKEDDAVDFGLAEALAFGSLLLEGIPVRLSGEDSARGTFAQRHSVWWDTESSKPVSHVPLASLSENQVAFSVYDSPLSEFSVLGFEYGYSLALPKALVLWEAQFGDFSNGAQVIIDNYIASGETKWGSPSGLVMLLPHGYEGQGPEHSSAHLERFLQLCARDNIQVCNATTPAQYFHLLRRQAHRRTSKPLVVMTTKSLLRHPKAVSHLADLTGGRFFEIIEDPREGGKVSALCFCSGKIYYELEDAKLKRGSTSTHIVRIEQLYPFPGEDILALLRRFPGVKDVYWVQEEPENRGAWSFVKSRFGELTGAPELKYIGRPERASTATGSHRRHVIEQEAILSEVFGDSGTGLEERAKSKRIGTTAGKR